MSLLVGALHKSFQKIGVNRVDNVQQELPVRFGFLIIIVRHIGLDPRVVLNHREDVLHAQLVDPRDRDRLDLVEFERFLLVLE